MKLKALAASVLLFGFSSSAMAIMCTSHTDWGSLGPPGGEVFGNSFAAAGSYSDCYTFSLASNANSFGGVIEVDPLLNRLDIDIGHVSLFSGGVAGGNTTGSLLGDDSSPLLFGFDGLTAGLYSFVVFANVESDWGIRNRNVGYGGAIATVQDERSVPEPGMLVLLGVGLVGVGLALRRRAAI